MRDDIWLAKIATKNWFENANLKFYYQLIPEETMMKRIPMWKQHKGN